MTLGRIKNKSLDCDIHAIQYNDFILFFNLNQCNLDIKVKAIV